MIDNFAKRVQNSWNFQDIQYYWSYVHESLIKPIFYNSKIVSYGL